MALSNDLLTQFAKIANKKEEPKKETTVYGTIVYDGATYVRIDGSDLLTPIATTTDVKDGDRVTVTIKNHNAIVTGNLDSPSVNKNTTIEIDETESTTVGEFGTVIAGKISAQRAEFNELVAKRATIEQLEAEKAIINELLAKKATVEQLEAEKAVINELLAKKATIEQLEAEKATINELLAKKATIEQLEAERAEIDELLAEKLTADTADIKYAQIDFANIGKAAMEYFYAQSGLIENVVVGDATIAGELVGVTLKGDLIEGNTVVADKLVIKGKDGMYYKLNYESGALTADGVAESTCYRVTYSADVYTVTYEEIETIEGSVVENASTLDGYDVYLGSNADGEEVYYCVIDDVYYSVIHETDVYTATEEDLGVIEGTLVDGALTSNTLREVYVTDDGIYYCKDLPTWATDQLHGNAIVAKSITAEKVNVHDLIAFGATIGNFHIGDNAIYSGVKTSADNSTEGIYLGSDGQVNIGDSNNYIKYFLDTDGTYKLAISAESVMYQLNGSSHSIADIGALTEYVKIGTYEYDIFINPRESDVTFVPTSSDPVIGTAEVNGVTKLVRESATEDGETVYYSKLDSVYYIFDRLIEPCIELGEKDSDFKMVITNTRIMFLDGYSVPAYVSNQALNIGRAVVEDELQIGGLVWKKRANGNVGLMWKGESE